MVRHSKDRLFLTTTEWKRDYGGKAVSVGSTAGGFKALPFNCCALSLAPFENPVCTTDGVLFDLVNIVPYIKKHKKNPASGEPLTNKQLIRLNFAKNSDDKWYCPVTCKEFTNSSRIVAIKTTGNVYAAEVVEELNVKAKNWTDLLTGEAFTRKDIITLNDPKDTALLARRDINQFKHLEEVREEKNQEAAKASHTSKIRQTVTTERIFKEIATKRKRDEETRAKKEADAAEAAAVQEEKDEAAGTLIWKRRKILVTDLQTGSNLTANAVSGSFTSTATAVETKNVVRAATPAEIDETRWARLKKLKKKGYAQLQTTHGNLNLEIHCDMVPQTAENFIGLCLAGKYNGVTFHRSIKNFMIQGGDPTGKGTGGESIWGGKFRDEFDERLTHDGRGVLSMANSGKNTNGSQFFIMYRSAPHLNRKHSVFGKVVGGMPALRAMEDVPTNSKDRPKEEIKIIKAVVFQNPIEEADAVLDAELKATLSSRAKAAAASKQPAAPALVKGKAKAGKGGVG
ncbi:unnamed protein product, partial [Chrysoparadoxa australica]